MTPRLLNESEARAYCGDIDPAKVTAPLRLGKLKRWDKVALDAALDRASGVESVRKEAPDDAFETWQRSA